MSMPNFDDFKLAVEAVSGGENTVIFDDLGMPSVMVPIPKMKYSDLIKDGSQNTHPGFIVNSVEKSVMYYSKYQNIVVNDRAYSLPLRDPAVNLNNDAALRYCRNKGRGWGLSPYSLWSAIALWTRANGTMPHGNNNHGADSNYAYEHGIEASKDGNTTGRTLTGSGPKTWYHDHTKNGIADLNGNVWEWCAGMRLVDGEIQVVPYANCMDPDVSLGANSTAWKAISAEGELVDPGTSGTLKYDYLSSKITLTTDAVTDDGSTGRSTPYASMGLKSGLTVPELAKALILYPDEPGGDYGGDYHYATLAGERVPVCGGAWSNTGTAGVFYVNLDATRGYSSTAVGFRSAYCDL